MMRILIAFALLLISISALGAGSTQETIVGLFRQVCIEPENAEAMMTAGRKIALERNWKRNEESSGRRPFFFMHHVDPTGAPFYVVETWNFSLPAIDEVKLFVGIVGPENPDVTSSLCSLDVGGEHVESVAAVIEKELGASLLRAKHKVAGVTRSWYPTRDSKTAESCGKSLSVSSYHPKTSTSLFFMNVKFPEKEKWRGLAAGFRQCQHFIEG